MAAAEHSYPHSVAPVASVWCRQVDNEAESPGYTAIPDEFPGRHEVLESIRTVGHLTVNVADTQDYWDPDPSQTLSFYPNLFLYPAAGGRYTCIGRMFLSTEDRPRLGMKTLVFSTEELVASGEFGPTILRAHTTMVGRVEPRRPLAPPDASVFQAVGEGFLFHRGTTEPVVIVASDQWEAVSFAVAELIRSMPAALVALSGFLVFPYFLPAPKVNLREFAEQIPLALAVMRVPRQEAEGDRHSKRMASWQSQAVSLRDLTRPPPARGKETLPLVLQYVRDHAEEKEAEVARRVDQVERPRLTAALGDPEAPTGRERRKEMWRIGTAMETAALLLARPRGRTIGATGEMAKRANEYLEARPGEVPLLAPAATPVAEIVTSPSPAAPTPEPPSTAPPSGPVPATAAAAPAAQPPAPAPPTAPATPGPPRGTSSLPQWLRAPPDITLPANEPKSVPVSTADDPSLTKAVPTPPVPTAPSAGRPVAPGGPAAAVPQPPPVAAVVPTPAEKGLLDARLSLAVRDLERRWTLNLDARLREATEASGRAAEAVRADLAKRLAELEARPAVTAQALSPEVQAEITARIDPKVAEAERRLTEGLRSTAEGWAERFRRELKEASEELSARSARSEEDLRAALVAQLDVELLEAKEQGTALREEIEGKVREILDAKIADTDQRRTKEMRELEQRVGILVDGRTKDIEEHLTASLTTETQRLAALGDDRVSHVERRLAVERDARLAEINEAHRASLAGLQVRMQAFVEQMVRENQNAEQEKYVELLARLKADLEQTIATTLGSAEFRSRLNEAVGTAVDRTETERSATLEKTIADAEDRLRDEGEATLARLTDVERQLASREGDIAAVEARLREELGDLDRRVMVVNDHILPIVRQTWLKLTENESNARAKVTDAQLQSLRAEVLAEVHRTEQEFAQQAADLRERLETNVQSHGRIWLNFLRQYSPGSEGFPIPASPSAHRTTRRVRQAPPPPPADDRPPFASDPPNPMDPELAEESEPREPRRKPRKSS